MTTAASESLDWQRRGPKPLLPGESNANRQWAWRMVDRARRGGVYGNYRRAELLTVLLPTLYELEGLFFPGPKRALAEMSPKLSATWANALKPGAPITAVEAVVRSVVGPRNHGSAGAPGIEKMTTFPAGSRTPTSSAP